MQQPLTEQAPIEAAPPAVAPRSPRQIISLIIAAVISVGALWLVLRNANVSQALAVIGGTQWWLVALAFGMQLVATGFTIRRWQVLLLPYPTRYLKLTQIFFIAHLLNTALPANLGTVARIILTAESENLNGGFVLGSVAVEKVLDTLLMLVTIIALTPFIPIPDWVRGALAGSALVVLIAFAVLVGVRRLREPLLALVARVEQRFFGASSQRLTTLVNGVTESVLNLTHRGEALRVLFWTLCLWISAGLVNQFLLAALDMHVDWTTAWLLLVVLQIGARVPALPANLGVFEYLVVLTLGLYGVDETTAFSYAILLHLLVFILPAFIGAVCALPVSARLSRLIWDRSGAQPAGT